MAAGERAEEPLAELSHYVVARPIYSEAGFQEENERRPPLPPTLRERAQAACRWVVAPGGRPVRRRERGAAGPPGSGEESRAPPGDAPCRRRRTPARRGSKGPEQRGSLGGSVFAYLSKRVEGRQPPAGCFLQEAALRTRFVPHPWLEGTAAAVPASKRASPPLSGGWGLPGASRLQPRGVRSSLVVFWQVFEKKGLSDCQVLSAHPGVAAQLPGERVADQRCHLGGQHRPRRHPAR